MVRKFKYLIFYLLPLILYACSINGTTQGLFSYYNKTKKEYPSLIAVTDSTTKICKIQKSEKPKVWLVNGKQLKKCAEEYPRMIVFDWSPNCSSNFCYSLDAVQKACDNSNVELFIVASYYDSEKMQINYNIEHPLFAIDTKYYHSNLTKKYSNKFLMDLTKSDESNGRLIYFENGQFSHSFKDIDSIPLTVN